MDQQVATHGSPTFASSYPPGYLYRAGSDGTSCSLVRRTVRACQVTPFAAKEIMSSMQERHSRSMGSDMHGLTFDEGAQFRPQRLVGDHVDRSTQQILQKELDAEVALGGGRALEGDQDVDVAVCPSRISNRRAEQSQPVDPVPVDPGSACCGQAGPAPQRGSFESPILGLDKRITGTAVTSMASIVALFTSFGRAADGP